MINSRAVSTQYVAKLTTPIRVSGFDLFNAMLVSAILIVGLVVSIMFLCWLTSVVEFSRADDNAIPKGNKVKFVNVGFHRYTDEVEPVGVENLPEVELPQLAAQLAAVTETVSTVRAAWEARPGNLVDFGRGGISGAREPGPGGCDLESAPLSEAHRWIIRYESDGIEAYARQLSYFRIDIGVIHKFNGLVWRVRDPAGQPTKILSSKTAEANSLMFGHRKQQMVRWDQSLAARQQIPLDNTVTVQFYPESTQELIRQAEAEALKRVGKSVVDLKNTIFKIEPSGDGFVFRVVELLFR